MNEHSELLEKKLAAFLSGFSLSKEEVSLIAEHLTLRSYKKGTVLIEDDKACKECFYVLKGCLRAYIFVGDIEKTTRFYSENQAAAFFGESRKEKAGSNLVCLEDSVLLVGDLEQEQEMYKRFPVLQQITQEIISRDFGKMQAEFTHFITSSPEERYMSLVHNRPELLQRVPQHYIASYLGIAPESLSRIRKRIRDAKKQH